MSTATETLAAALAYQAHGWPVFVLRPDKAPYGNCRDCPGHSAQHDGETCECLTCHGFYAATLDDLRIARMIADHPGCLLAVRTGAPSGIVALDVDERENGTVSLARLETALGVLPGTVMQCTPGGVHMLYRHPGHRVKSGSGLLGADLTGLDIKADGGYILVAPSQRQDGGRYRWFRDEWRHELPPWPAHLDALLQPKPLAPRPVHLSTAGQGRPGTRAQAYALAALRGECDELAAMPPESGRNNRLNRAAVKLGHYVNEGHLDRELVEAELLAAARACGCPGAEATIRSGLDASTRLNRPTGGAA